MLIGAEFERDPNQIFILLKLGAWQERLNNVTKIRPEHIPDNLIVPLISPVVAGDRFDPNRPLIFSRSDGSGRGTAVGSFKVDSFGRVIEITWSAVGSGHAVGDIFTFRQDGNTVTGTYTIRAVDLANGGSLVNPLIAPGAYVCYGGSYDQHYLYGMLFGNSPEVNQTAIIRIDPQTMQGETALIPQWQINELDYFEGIWAYSSWDDPFNSNLAGVGTFTTLDWTPWTTRIGQDYPELLDPDRVPKHLSLIHI